jgi:lipopolysaccharide biosynthesis regulator YciM
MPNEVPAFLQDFMNHRKHMTKQDLMSPAVKKSESLKPAKNELEVGIEGIIEKRPKNKVVKEFLQNRIDELSKGKMK